MFNNVRREQRGVERERDFFAGREVYYLNRRVIKTVRNQKNFKIRTLRIPVKPGL